MRACWWVILLVGCATENGPTHTEVVAPSNDTPKYTPSSVPAMKKPWHGKGSDRDGDGIADGHDQCPDDPEDFDGFQDEDGCPDPDNDHDGVPDQDDSCPNQVGPAPTGCPVMAAGDRDGDGIPDNVDKCPDDPEDKDGFQDADGCPDPDNDSDGILDVNDKCPNQPGPAKTGGCPSK